MTIIPEQGLCGKASSGRCIFCRAPRRGKSPLRCGSFRSEPLFFDKPMICFCLPRRPRRRGQDQQLPQADLYRGEASSIAYHKVWMAAETSAEYCSWPLLCPGEEVRLIFVSSGLAGQLFEPPRTIHDFICDLMSRDLCSLRTTGGENCHGEVRPAGVAKNEIIILQAARLSAAYFSGWRRKCSEAGRRSGFFPQREAGRVRGAAWPSL